MGKMFYSYISRNSNLDNPRVIGKSDIFPVHCQLRQEDNPRIYMGKVFRVVRGIKQRMDNPSVMGKVVKDFLIYVYERMPPHHMCVWKGDSYICNICGWITPNMCGKVMSS